MPTSKAYEKALERNWPKKTPNTFAAFNHAVVAEARELLKRERKRQPKERKPKAVVPFTESSAAFSIELYSPYAEDRHKRRRPEGLNAQKWTAVINHRNTEQYFEDKKLQAVMGQVAGYIYKLADA